MSNILLHVSGSISAFKAASLAGLLVREGHQVQCSLSEGGERFLGAATLEGISRNRVLTDMWSCEPDPVPHITLARDWADLILVYPAGANCINRLAAGLCDDLIGAVFLANNGGVPFWIAPAMNSHMLAHPSVQKSLSLLEEYGCRILPTESGLMACGSRGDGRLIAPESLMELLKGELPVTGVTP